MEEEEQDDEMVIVENVDASNQAKKSSQVASMCETVKSV